MPSAYSKPKLHRLAAEGRAAFRQFLLAALSPVDLQRHGILQELCAHYDHTIWYLCMCPNGKGLRSYVDFQLANVDTSADRQPLLTPNGHPCSMHPQVCEGACKRGVTVIFLLLACPLPSTPSSRALSRSTKQRTTTTATTVATTTEEPDYCHPRVHPDLVDILCRIRFLRGAPPSPHLARVTNLETGEIFQMSFRAAPAAANTAGGARLRLRTASCWA
jgi:hypothetical protein